MCENTQLAAALDTLRELTAYRLANEADCGCPDTPDSAGASFLVSVLDSFIERVEYAAQDSSDDAETIIESLRDDGSLSEIADGAPDVYTSTLWAEFVELQAYHEDPTELADGSDMEQSARVCLYMIAERLTDALSQLFIDAYGEDVAEGGES